jgi:hypothetical protein
MGPWIASASCRRGRAASAIAAASLVCAAACARVASAPEIRLRTAETNSSQAWIEVVGLAGADLQALGRASWDVERWTRLLRVTVQGAAGDAPPVAGRHSVAQGAIRFVPMYPLDPGRAYEVRFDPSALPTAPAGREAVTTVVARHAAPHQAATTTVTHISPDADIVPENQLRMYVHFSAPMGRQAALEHVALLDDAGREVKDPFLPLDVEFFNADRTRYTLFFDPGRVKRGIMPNRDLGPSLVEGRRYTLVIRPTWRDAHDRPLQAAFERSFVVGPPDLDPLDIHQWTLDVPAPGSTAPLAVSFGEPLDEGLLLRALGVRLHGATVEGDIRLDAHAARWLFTPRTPWSAGRYELVALSILEDLAGNRLGRAFEVKRLHRDESSTGPEYFRRPFVVGRIE